MAEDCVEGKKGESKTLLTFTFRNCHLMLMFLLEHQDQECVLEVFVWLETVLGKESFKRLFPVILTDGGSEFSAREEMETFCDGSASTTLFYCDPYSFWQKGACEKNHEYIRLIRGQLIIPKAAREKFGLTGGQRLIVLSDEKEGIALIPAEIFETKIEAAMQYASKRK